MRPSYAQGGQAVRSQSTAALPFPSAQACQPLPAALVQPKSSQFRVPLRLVKAGSKQDTQDVWSEGAVPTARHIPLASKKDTPSAHSGTGSASHVCCTHTSISSSVNCSGETSGQLGDPAHRCGATLRHLQAAGMPGC